MYVNDRNCQEYHHFGYTKMNSQVTTLLMKSIFTLFINMISGVTPYKYDSGVMFKQNQIQLSKHMMSSNYQEISHGLHYLLNNFK